MCPPNTKGIESRWFRLFVLCPLCLIKIILHVQLAVFVTPYTTCQTWRWTHEFVPKWDSCLLWIPVYDVTVHRIFRNPALSGQCIHSRFPFSRDCYYSIATTFYSNMPRGGRFSRRGGTSEGVKMFINIFTHSRPRWADMPRWHLWVRRTRNMLRPDSNQHKWLKTSYWIEEF